MKIGNLKMYFNVKLQQTYQIFFKAKHFGLMAKVSEVNDKREI